MLWITLKNTDVVNFVHNTLADIIKCIQVFFNIISPGYFGERGNREVRLVREVLIYFLLKLQLVFTV